MNNQSSLNINYDDLVNHNLVDEFNIYSEIVCNVHQSHARILKKSWGKYERYARAHASNPAKLKNFFFALSWLTSQAYLDLKFESLSKLTELYIDSAEKLAPVEFADQGDIVAIHFRKKL